jgi:hypothetical protein
MMHAMRWAFGASAVAALTLAISCGTSLPRPTETPVSPQLTGINGGTLTPVPLVTSGTSSGTSTTLTPEGRQRVEEIVRQDPVMAEITGDVPYTVQNFGPWYDGPVPSTGEDLFIGGTATVVLSTPIAHVERDWPVTGTRPYYPSWPADARAKYLLYTETTERQAVDNLSHMQVLVDLSRGKLAEITVISETQYGQKVTASHVEPTPEVSIGAPQNASDILNGDDRVAALLAGRTHQTGASFTYVWGNLHFATVEIAFDQPQDIDADWPILIQFDNVSGGYETDTIHFTATAMQYLTIAIDLDKGEVAWIGPGQRHGD